MPPSPVTELDIRTIVERRADLPLARSGRGYKVAQVDAFLDGIVASLRAVLAENEGLRTGVEPGHFWFGNAAREGRHGPSTIAATTFEIGWFGGGYKMREVDELLDQVTDQLARLEAENEALRAHNGSS
jgi:DivIVA domain-containing protein